MMVFVPCTKSYYFLLILEAMQSKITTTTTKRGESDRFFCTWISWKRNMTFLLTSTRFPPKTFILNWQFSILLLSWSWKDLKTIFKKKFVLSSKSHGCSSRPEMLQKQQLLQKYLGYMQHFRRAEYRRAL